MKTQFICLALVVAILCPRASAQWKQTNGPYGGRVTCFAFSGKNLFAGTLNGIFLSTNNGTSWTAVNTGLTKTYVNALAVSGTNLFAGTNAGVYLSTNSGTSWTAVNAGLTNTSVYALAVSGTNLFAGTSGGVFLSANSGTSWTAVNAGLTNTSVYALAVSGTNLFAGTNGGVYLSINNGTSWTAVNAGLTRLSVNCLAISGSNLFAGVDGDGLFVSTNNGTSWTAVNLHLTGYKIVLALAVSGTNIFAGTHDGVFRSTDNGTTWTISNSGLIDKAVFSLGIFTNEAGGKNLFAGTGAAGIFCSTDNGSSWNPVSTGGIADVGVETLFVRGAELFAATCIMYGRYNGGDGGECIFHSTDNGDTWVPQLALGATSFAMQATVIFAGTIDGLFISTNNGTSWTEADTSLRIDVRALAVSGTRIFAGTGNGVFLSTNNGTSWTAANAGLTSRYVWCFAIAGSNLFAGNDWDGLFVSTNNGTSWTAANTGLTDKYVFALAVSPASCGSGTNIFAGTYNGVFRSTDYGSSWTACSSGLPKDSYDSSRYAPATTLVTSGANIFAGTGNEVFLSTNNGTNWRSVNLGVNLGLNTLVWSLGVNDTYLFVGTTIPGPYDLRIYSGKGLWRRPLSEIVTAVDEKHNEVPSSFMLLQNYPNPFNPSTTITYELPRMSHVSLSVYNLLGMEVSNLLNEEKPAGVHTVQFNGSGLASGVYFYRLQARDFIQTRKLVIVK